MSLEDQIKIISDDFEGATPETIIDVLNQIKPHFKSQLSIYKEKSKKFKILIMVRRKRNNARHYYPILIGICKDCKISLKNY
jgi:hypothetical protein